MPHCKTSLPFKHLANAHTCIQLLVERKIERNKARMRDSNAVLGSLNHLQQVTLQRRRNQCIIYNPLPGICIEDSESNDKIRRQEFVVNVRIDAHSSRFREYLLLRSLKMGLFPSHLRSIYVEKPRGMSTFNGRMAKRLAKRGL